MVTKQASRDFQDAAVRCALSQASRLRGISTHTHLRIVWANFSDHFVEPLAFLNMVSRSAKEIPHHQEVRAAATSLIAHRSALTFWRTQQEA